jgi:SAM-dependent methyltransferase
MSTQPLHLQPALDSVGLFPFIDATDDLNAQFQEISARVSARGDLPDATVKLQLDLLEELKKAPIGQSFICTRELTAWATDWCSYGPFFNQCYAKLSPFEKTFLNLPICTATQERLIIMRQLLQVALHDDMDILTVPCGLMGNLAALDYQGLSNVTIDGIDINPQTIAHAKNMIKLYRPNVQISLKVEDAWDIDCTERYDLILCHGLTIYEPDDRRVMELYRKFHRALKPGGKLIVTTITPPTAENSGDWDMTHVDLKMLLLQRILIKDMVNVDWQSYRTIELTEKLLEDAEFKNPKVHPDRVRMFPTLVAIKD